MVNNKQLNAPAKETPVFISWFKTLFDIIATVLLLAAAVIGAAEQIKSGDNDVRIGAACVLVGLLAARLLERLFERKA